jgi:hypothetical protein
MPRSGETTPAPRGRPDRERDEERVRRGGPAREEGVTAGRIRAGRARAGEHLVRLAAIRALKARYLPLAEVGRRLAAMGPEEIEALVASPDEPADAFDAVGRPLGGVGGATAAGTDQRPAALAGFGTGGFGLPSARGKVPRGAVSSTPLPRVGSNLWQRVLLAPGVELSFQVSGDPSRDQAIADLVEQATRRLAEFGASPPAEEK